MRSDHCFPRLASQKPRRKLCGERGGSARGALGHFRFSHGFPEGAR